MKMASKRPVDLHRVEPLVMPDVNAMILFIGAVAFMVIIGLLFNFMMDDFNLLLVKSIWLNSNTFIFFFFIEYDKTEWEVNDLC